jgi:DNA (cytosine-5)-methyltransferase 1
MNVLDLFSGIGGFSLGLERAGMRTVAFCESSSFCRRVLMRRWPGVHCYDDIRTLTADRLAADGIAADVICGGFPCQDISNAGKGAGIDGERSGLWTEFARIICEVRPRYVVVENVAALLNRGLDKILADLAALGFDAEWHCIPACAVGAPHRRDRVWIVATMADAAAVGFQERHRLLTRRQIADAAAAAHAWWEFEPGMGRVADGIPDRVDRLKALGNAVVPQIAELIGHAIMRRQHV